MRKPSKGQKARRPSEARAQLIQDFLRDGITVTVGGVPIQITLGASHASTAPRRDAAKAAAPAPKPRKARRRKSRRVLAPDPRDIRGYLATQMEGATLTALASHFKVKRPLMKRMLRRMAAKKEITLFKGAFFNAKRLRQRRITSKYTEAMSAVAEQLPAPLAAVPDSEKQEPQTPESLPHPESDAA